MKAIHVILLLTVVLALAPPADASGPPCDVDQVHCPFGGTPEITVDCVGGVGAGIAANCFF